MDFENREAFVVPFKIQESFVWKSVAEYLSQKETTPVESICNSHIVSIEKEYYPIERLEISYTTQWDAISIFKEYWTETETHYENQIHYFDRLGKEHEKPGFDRFNPKTGNWSHGAFRLDNYRFKGYSGDRYTRPWEAREVTVAVTEEIPYSKEIGRKKTNGKGSGKHIGIHNAQYPFSNENFPEPERIPYSKEIVRDTVIMEKAKPFSEKDYNSELSAARAKANKECKKQIPGHEYVDFSMEFKSDDVFQTWYYPVYHVTYTFQEQKYECFVSGYYEKTVNGKHNPEDKSIETIKQQYDDEYTKLKEIKKKFWLRFVWIYFGIVVAGTAISSFLSFFHVSGFIESILELVLFLSITIYLFKKNYKEIKNIKEKITQNRTKKDNIIPIRQEKKKSILEIVLDDSLSDNEKIMRCEKILNN